MGHTWLRVRVGLTSATFAPGAPTICPARSISRRWRLFGQGDGFVLALTHLGMIGFCGFLECGRC